MAVGTKPREKEWVTDGCSFFVLERMRVGEISKEKRDFGFGRKVDDDGSQAAIVLWEVWLPVF